MMKKTIFLIMLLFLFSLCLKSQSRKEQIVTLTKDNDSLTTVINNKQIEITDVKKSIMSLELKNTNFKNIND
jgi:thioredoxin-related protein